VENEHGEGQYGGKRNYAQPLPLANN